MRPDASKPRAAPDPWDIGFGVALLAFGLLALFVWFPADIPTGFFFTNAIGREEPGDAFFPTILAVILCILSVIQILQSWFSAVRQDQEGSGRITADNLKFISLFIVITGIGLALMHWLGPLTVALLNAADILEGGYRHFSDTAPYKYIGYVVGGAVMTLALIVWAEGRIRPLAVYTVFGVLIIAILLFDIALKNVLLPPNADF